MIIDNYWVGQATIMLALLLAYEMFFRNSSQHSLNRIYLLLLTAASIVIPLIEIDAIPYVVESIPTTRPTSATVQLQPSQSHQWKPLTIVYLVGLVASLGLFLIRTAITWRHFSKMSSSTAYHGSAMSFFHYILLPIDCHEDIAQHEAYHVKAGHSFDRLLLSLAHCFFWYNPLFILVHRRLVEAHEFAADQHVIGSRPAPDKLA